MNDNNTIEIRILARDGSAQVLKGTVSNLDAVGAAAKRNGLLLADSSGKEIAFKGLKDGTDAVTKNLDEVKKKSIGVGDELDRVGSRGRLGLNAAAQAARLLGVDISGVLGPAASAADVLGDIGQSASSLGLVGVGVGAAVVGIGLFVSVMEERNRAVAEGILKNDAFVQSLKTFTATNAEAVQMLQLYADARARAETGWSLKVGDIVENSPLMGPAKMALHAFGVDLKDLNPVFETSSEEAARLKEELAALEKQFYQDQYAAAAFSAEMQKLSVLDPKLDLPNQRTDPYSLALAQGEGVVNRYKAGTISLSEAVNTLSTIFGLTKEQVDALRQSMLGLNEVSESSGTTAMRVQGRWSAYERELSARLPVTFDMAKDKYGEWQTALKDTSGYDRAKAAAAQLRDAVRSAVEAAIQPTSVTDEDVKAAALGNYVDKWDEARRRLEAVDTGTDPAQYGKKFEDAFAWLKSIGYDAKSAAAAMRDFSLYADPANLSKAFETGLIDLDAIIPQVEGKIDSIIGKANLLQSAFEQVWAGMSQQKKIDLANALGLETGTMQNIDSLKNDIEGKITNPASDAATEVGNISSAISGIPKSVTSVFDVTKTDNFDLDLKEILDDIKKIPGEITIRVGFANNLPDPNGSSGGSSGPTPDPNTSGNGVPSLWKPPGMAMGGYTQGHKTYVLGEQGPEFVIPANWVKYIEGVLGGPIKSPDQIGFLIGALKRGPQEAAFAIQNWASGMAGWGVDMPADAQKWINNVRAFGPGGKMSYGDFLASQGISTGDSSGASGGSSGGGGGLGGTVVDVTKSDTFDDNLKSILDDLNKIPREINTKVAPGNPAVPGTSNLPVPAPGTGMTTNNYLVLQIDRVSIRDDRDLDDLCDRIARRLGMQTMLKVGNGT